MRTASLLSDKNEMLDTRLKPVSNWVASDGPTW